LSAHFAIPATSFVLKAIIEARLKAAYGTFTPPKVSIEPPPRPPAPAPGSNALESTALILYLHHAGPNVAWRNMYEPHVDGNGKRFAKAPLVLDLYYMLTAQGLDLEREVVLGVGMNALHRNAIVPRPMIQQILGAITIPSPPTKLMDSLTGEPLADPNNQPESITITQQAVDIDMSTKLWSALQSPIRPCAYYLVTTVFLDVGETFPADSTVDHLVLAARPVADPAANPANDDIVTVRAPP
jgi:Pvc16 N-terminal domain